MPSSLSLFLFLSLTFFADHVSTFTFDKEGNALEPTSSAAFPAHLGSAKLDLVGMAVRVKRIVFVDFKVYAVGLYIDSKSAAQKLSSVDSLDAARDGPEIFRALVDSDFKKAIRLVMLRSVSGDQMGSAIGEAVESRLKAITASLSSVEQESANTAFKAFRDQFNLAELAAGTELIFWMEPSGSLAVTVASTKTDKIQSKYLCNALMDVYVGENAVVERDSLVSGLKKLIA